MANHSGNVARNSRLGFRRRTWVAILILCLVVGLCHHWLLQSAIRLLIVDESPVHATTVVPVGGVDLLTASAALVAQGKVDNVLLIETFPPAVARYHVLPPWVEVAQSALEQLGVQDSQVVVKHGQPSCWTETVLALGEWMDDHPHDTFILFCSRLEGRTTRSSVNSLLAVEKAQRIYVVALPEPDLDESCWWRQRLGLKSVFSALIYWVIPEYLLYDPPGTPIDWDEYERGLHAAH